MAPVSVTKSLAVFFVVNLDNFVLPYYNSYCKCKSLAIRMKGG